MTIKRGDLMRV